MLAFGEPLDSACRVRLAALRSVGSTRLGAALRHAVRQLARRRDGEQIVVVLSDADPHDVDVHDPLYLVDDALQAVRRARRQGVRVACIAIDAGCAPTARRIFGAGGSRVIERLAGLPRVLRSLLG